MAAVTRLETAAIMWLVTLRNDGSPHLTPIWFTWVDGAFWCCTTSDARKTRNVRRDPRVAVSLEDGSSPTIAEGEAVVHTAPFPDAVVAAFARKFDWDITHDPEGYDTLIEIRPRRWLMGRPTGT
jgi:PPOX class probable F420-dependent enzyme